MSMASNLMLSRIKLVKGLSSVVSRLQHVTRCMSSEPDGDTSPRDKSALFNTVVTRSAKQELESNVSRTITSDFTVADGKKIHYLKTGNGKHTVVLLPGALGAAKTDFGPQLSNLNKDLFTVVGWDPPGYGLSRPPDRDFTGDFLRKDAHCMAAFMENLGYSKYSLVGWSDGGISALMFASLYPERLNKIVVWGANSYITKEETEILRSIEDISNWSESMRKPFLELYGEEYFQSTWSGWIENFISRYYVQNKGDICKGDLQNIKCPSLVIHGQKDPVVPRFHADYVHENIKGARLEVLQEGKHNVHLRYFKEFNSIVEAFLLEQN